MMAVNFQSQHLLSAVERYGPEGKDARIMPKYSLDEPVQRYAATKELCHVAMNEPEDFFAPDVVQISTLLDGGPLDLSKAEHKAVWSEQAAETTARELLYPHEWRRADLAALERGEVTVQTLAIKYKIPDLVVSRVLQPRLQDGGDEFWNRARKAA